MIEEATLITLFVLIARLEMRLKHLERICNGGTDRVR